MSDSFYSTRSRKSDIGSVKFSRKGIYSSVPSEDPEESGRPLRTSGSENDEAEVIIWDNDTNVEDEDRKSLIPSEVDKDGVVREYEVALEHLGFGLFHIILLCVNGVALLSDAVEVLAISFVFPVLMRNKDWGVGSKEQAILSSIIFVGMLFGSYIWGGLADVIGRRPTLILSLTISVVFGVLSAFSPWFWLFVAFRLFSGFGVGGSLPVIMPYCTEFIRNEYRGSYLSIQSIFWMFGRLLCGGIAWLILSMDDFHWAGYQIHNWRVFLAISALPAFIGAVMYFIFPESPRYLLEVGKQQEALRVLRLVYRVNHPFTRKEYPVKAILLDGVQNESLGTKTWRRKMKTVNVHCKEIFFRNMDLFQRKYLRQTLLLLVVMFCLSFGGYGVTLWYPTYVSELNAKRDAVTLRSYCNKSPGQFVDLVLFCDCSGTVFEDVIISHQELRNWKINDVLFQNVTFFNVTFESVLFNNTKFKDCTILSSRFIGAYFNNTKYYNRVVLQSMDILPDSVCISDDSEGEVEFVNVTVNGEMMQSTIRFSQWTDEDGVVDVGCSANKYANMHCSRGDEFRVYRDSFFVSASGLPGNIASAVGVYYLRRNHWLAMSMLASTASVFLLYVVTSETFVVAMLCLFTAVVTPSWHDSGLIIAELYPTSLRTTAAGAHLLMARIGAIAGTNIFGLFVLVNPSIPILLVASLLCVGSVAAMALPTTTRKTLLK